MEEGKKENSQLPIVKMLDFTIEINKIPYTLGEDSQNNLHLLDESGKSKAEVKIDETTDFTPKMRDKDNEMYYGPPGSRETTYFGKVLIIPGSLIKPNIRKDFGVQFASKVITKKGATASSPERTFVDIEWRQGNVWNRQLDYFLEDNGIDIKIKVKLNTDNGEILPIQKY